MWRNWNFSDEMILEAAKASAGKSSPVAYMNGILSNWKNQGVKNLEQAKQQSVVNNVEAKPSVNNKYSKEELNALFSNLDYQEV